MRLGAGGGPYFWCEAVPVVINSNPAVADGPTFLCRAMPAVILSGAARSEIILPGGIRGRRSCFQVFWSIIRVSLVRVSDDALGRRFAYK